MLYRRPRIGQEINAYCGKCKLDRTHIVAAMDSDVVRKVTCSMCGSTHNYRGKPAAKEPARKTTTRTTKAGSRSKAEPFAIDPKRPVKAYNMDTSFAAGDVINHPKFGLGNVETALPPNKIEVRFQEGKKLLLHNMKNTR